MPFSFSNTYRGSAPTNTAPQKDAGAEENEAFTRIQHAAVSFRQKLDGIIPPRSRSDRTCFDQVARWLPYGCIKNKFDTDIFNRALDFANETRQGQKPAAIFMALLKKELGYRHGK